ncbi:hypothetical protein RRG08_063839 [Elysia crispata]|uniref:Uncharacterized protein n=1 Tax=Elysia crispata TaxID=231223 RepID=A0AAE0Y579_9GAST|nr:hypothetical protein RRG08_063839 [Elysia crispata]
MHCELWVAKANKVSLSSKSAEAENNETNHVQQSVSGLGVCIGTDMHGRPWSIQIESTNTSSLACLLYLSHTHSRVSLDEFVEPVQLQWSRQVKSQRVLDYTGDVMFC